MCKNTAQIPFFIAQIINVGTNSCNLLPYTLSVNPWAPVTSGTSLQCLDYAAPSFSLPPSRFSQVANCAMGVVDLNAPLPLDASHATTAVPDTSKMAVYCVACKPGYRPTYAVVGNRATEVVVRREKIAGCGAYSTRVNGCSECAINYVLGYDPTRGVDHTCSTDLDQNCYAKEGGACAICKKGFAPNFGGLCEPTLVDSCDVASAEVLERFYARDVEHYALFNRTNGCTSCLPGFVPLLHEKSLKLCARYWRVQAHGAYPTNCDNYASVNGTVPCARCRDGHVITVANNCARPCPNWRTA